MCLNYKKWMLIPCTIIFLNVILILAIPCYAHTLTEEQRIEDYYINQENALEGVNKAGNNALNLFRGIAYWIIVIRGMLDLVTIALNGDTKQISKILMKYLAVYASLFALPYLLRLIETLFI